MAETAPEMKPMLGLSELTMNAMALIAPGAFLWLTFSGQAAAGAIPPAMWAGILFATVLCLATAVCYAEKWPSIIPAWEGLITSRNNRS